MHSKTDCMIQKKQLPYKSNYNDVALHNLPTRLMVPHVYTTNTPTATTRIKHTPNAALYFTLPRATLCRSHEQKCRTHPPPPTALNLYNGRRLRRSTFRRPWPSSFEAAILFSILDARAARGRPRLFDRRARVALKICSMINIWK